MRRLYPLYPLLLALLVGGNALYTFLATPAVFAHFERDLAGRVVAAMMPYYFRYELALFLAAAAVFWLAGERARGFGASLALLGAGILASVTVVAWVYPAMTEVRALVPSFAADAPMTAARAAFRRLHGVSSALNLLQLGVATALLLLASRRAPRPPPQ